MKDTASEIRNSFCLLKLCEFFHLISAASLGSNHLLKANVLLINHGRCSDESVYGRVLDVSMVCAGHLQGGVDSCQVSRKNLTAIIKDIVYIH